MGFDLACPSCECGLLVTDPADDVVACPECGTPVSLTDGAAAPRIADAPDRPDAFPFDPPDSNPLPDSGPPPAARPWPDFGSLPEPGRTEGDDAARLLAAVSRFAVVIPPPDEPQPAAEQPVPEPASAPVLSVRPAPAAASRPRSGLGFLLLLSYASAVTIALAALVYKHHTADPHQLESLPDVVPEVDRGGNIVPKVVSENAPMPPGHTLRLGESQRFGHLEVTPLRVTRGPLEFEHFRGPEAGTRPPAGEVLKLWLRFKNVSADQSFPPLGKELAYLRGPASRDLSRIIANQVVFRAEERESGGPVVLLYDLVVADAWDLKDQNVDTVLGPDEAFETYLPTAEEGIDRLHGDLVWRVHVRKGYHPDSLRGVTTLFEVVFHSDEIESEARGARPPGWSAS